MTTRINDLYQLCKEQPFDVEKIKFYIKNNNMNSEEVTRVALKLCDHGMFSYQDFIYHNERDPQREELATYNWELLFNVLIDNGLDANLVICDDAHNYENILQSVLFFDDGDLAARVLRNILSKGGTPNVVIDNTPLFVKVDAEFITDMEMDLYPYKWQFDNAFRNWFVLIGFGGVIEDGKLPVNLCEGYTTHIFKEFERFDYRIAYIEKELELQIIEKETNAIVATV